MAKRVSVDRWLFTVTMLLVFVGLVMVFSASAVMARERFASEYWFLSRQLIWALAGLGAMVVKPERHVTSVADLSEDEAVELGPLLRRASIVARQLVDASQVYNCLWSHAGGEPVHIHYVVQPVTEDQMSHFGVHGPSLQVAMFATGEPPAAGEIEQIAALARLAFAE